MTTYSFIPPDTNFIQYWDSPSIWSPAAVPNGPSAVVRFPAPPAVNANPDQVVVFYQVQIKAGESYAVGTVDLAGYTLYDLGSLAVSNEMTIGGGNLYSDSASATFAFGSLDNDGLISAAGKISVAGTAVNRGVINGSETITAARFENIGTLFDGAGPLTIASAGFVNLSGGTLTGGTYELGNGQGIHINVNGPIANLAADLQILGSATLQTYGAGGTTYVPVQSSLTTIAPSGLLATQISYANANALTVQGQVIVGGGSFSAPSLVIAGGGAVAASAFDATATLSAAGGIIDNGAILATINPEVEGAGNYENSTLLVSSAVSGSGVLVVGAGQGAATVTLELAAADSAAVIFADATGTLQLDAPRSFSGVVKGFASGDSIVLSGIALSAVTSSSYSGGVLTLNSAGGAVNLAFQGNYSASSFSLAAGAQGVVITDSAGAVSPNWTAATAVTAYHAGTLAAGSVVADNAANVAAQIDGLQTLAAAGDLSAIVLTDLDSATSPVAPPAMSVTATQFLADSRVFPLIDSAYTLTVTGATALQAESIAGNGHIASIAVSDSAADIASQIDRLGTLASTAQVSAIAVTDSAFPAISVTSSQFTADHTAFDEMSGNFSVVVSAGANTTIETVRGHGVTVAFPGAASQYSMSAQGDGIGLTVGSDSLRGITAVQFSDFTDIVAQTPGSGGTVTTGNIAELYGAVFGRLPDVPGLAFYQAYLTVNPTTPLTQFAQYFLASPEYTGNAAHTYAQSTAGDSQFITDCYENLLHRAPETGAIPYYLKVIDSFTDGLAPGTAAYAAAQTLGHAYVLTYFSQSPEFLGDVQVTAAHPASAQHWLLLI